MGMPNSTPMSKLEHYDDPGVDATGDSQVPWKMGTVEYSIPAIKHYRGAKPCELQHPALKHCRQTRMLRDVCVVHHGNCEYKIEAHFQCLEQFYPKEKVDKYRKAYIDPAFDNYEVIDNLVARAPYYYSTDFNINWGNPSTRF
eukprot:TRINITY_DN27554_c0_g1_i1.p1 TRINITY_DN27554_c0_g1~~TRINITY_DN27554_c0_g1_i1.p1  ORF type:complete len:143 (+),score=55.57 TRINITY_DN27554_c0_g1_i1:54-482(+)